MIQRPRARLLVIGVLAMPAIGLAQPVIEEIIVVAQKRQQGVQDVGISVAAIDGSALRERGIDQSESLYSLIPNMNLQNNGGGGAPVVIVRGVGLQSFRINDSPTTAFYVDEVYQPSVASAEWTLFDIEQVEVLRGPQGGLYGRNAVGSAIQIISREPDLDAGREGYVSLAYAQFSQTELETAGTFALSDKAALRVAGRWLQSSESPYRSVTGGFDHGTEERGGGRLTLRIEPNDRLDLVLRLHGGRDESELPPLRAVGVYAPLGTAAPLAPTVSRALLAGLQGLLPTPLCAPLLAGGAADPAACATATGVTPAGYGLAPGMPRDSASAFQGFMESDWAGGNVTLELRRNDYRLQSITARDTIDYRRFQDFDATPLEHLHIDYNTRIEAWSQELRLFYDGGGRLSWVAGLTYAEDDLEETTPLYGAQGALPLLFGGAVFSPQRYLQDTRAAALYGHAEWRFSNAWNLVTELRYTDEDKSFVGDARLGFPNGATVPFVSTDDSTSFDAWSGKVALEWSVTDEVLAYGSIARGFKTGGFFGGFPTSVDQLRPFEAETLWALELGMKSDWLGGRLRLNGSVFYYERQDVQQNAADPASAINIKRITNIGDVDTVGAEVELSWLAGERLSIDFGLGTTDAEVSDSGFIQASSLPLLPDTPIKGTNLPNYPQRSANLAVRYQAPFGNALEYFVQLEARYQSEQDLSVITQPIERAVFTEPGYSLWNLRFGIGPVMGRWQAQAFVANLADETYRILARNDGAFGIHELYGMPRTWGVSFERRWP